MSARTSLARRVSHAATLVAVTAFAASGLVVMTTGAADAGAPAAGAAAAGDGPWTGTKTLTRAHVAADGSEQVVDQRQVTVSVDKTSNLRGRERVTITWAGARPSAGRAVNPFGEGGMKQEYPVVILQCRGLDDPDLPPAQRLSPETCWTSTWMQRTSVQPNANAVWRHDRHASEADRALKSGVDPYPAEQCDDVRSFGVHVTPFRAAGGQQHLSCTSTTMAPEAAADASYPPAEQAAFTTMLGTGSAKFEVRSNLENESLGCSHRVACSIVVIPIMGISCLDADPVCRREGRFAPGSSNFADEGIDLAVGPQLWWAASNWRHRFAVPISFGLPPNTCDVLDPRAPTGFYGSELLSQAALQWAPAYCLDRRRFKFQHNRMPDRAGFNLMDTGEAAAALVSSAHESREGSRIGYAPTAVTGFAISYVIDRPDNAGELTELRLTPRLVAKLLTQSYTGSDLGRQHKGMRTNPLSINLDPEFQALNPGLDRVGREAAATVLSLSEDSDVIQSLTEWIARDEQAMDFVAGTADEWGMVVNPSYRGLDLPLSEWPLLDEFVPQVEQECLKQNPAPYFTQLAAPVTTLRTVAEAVLDAWPNVQTRCERSTSTDPWRLGRVVRQGVGSRFMLGIVSLGDAERFGLRTAALETAPGRFVAPSEASILRAVGLMKPTGKHQPFSLAQADVAKDGGAYPGTMIVYTAARLSGMAKAEAIKVAQFIRVATTEGQRPGRGNGQLPGGYVPIRASGPTARLYAAARDVANQVQAQRAAPASDGPGTDPTSPSSPTASPSAGTPGAGPGVAPPGTAPSGGLPQVGGPPSAAPGGPVPGDVQTLATEVDSSRLAAWVLPLLLGLGILGALVTAVLRTLAVLQRRPR